jgi:hypothetical protein
MNLVLSNLMLKYGRSQNDRAAKVRFVWGLGQGQGLFVCVDPLLQPAVYVAFTLSFP